MRVRQTKAILFVTKDRDELSEIHYLNWEIFNESFNVYTTGFRIFMWETIIDKQDE